MVQPWRVEQCLGRRASKPGRFNGRGLPHIIPSTTTLPPARRGQPVRTATKPVTEVAVILWGDEGSVGTSTCAVPMSTWACTL